MFEIAKKEYYGNFQVFEFQEEKSQQMLKYWKVQKPGMCLTGFVRKFHGYKK